MTLLPLSSRASHFLLLCLIGCFAWSPVTSNAQSSNESESREKVQERVQGAVNAANDLWRTKHKPDKAREVLTAARAKDTNAAPLLMTLAVLEVYQTNHAAADRVAQTALSLAATPLEILNARAVLGFVLWDEILQGNLRSGLAYTNADRIGRVQEAVALLDLTMQSEPGWRYPSEFQIFLALYAGNGPAALRAWQSYYHVAPGEPVPEPLVGASQTLNRLLPAFTNTTDAPTRRQIVEALAASRLFAEAAALALQWKLEPDDTLRDIILYGRWTEQLGSNLGEEYRLHAMGKNRKDHTASLKNIMSTQAESLWKQLHWKKPPKRFTMDRFTHELETRFGAHFRLIYPDYLSYTHRVAERRVTVEQYGHKQVMNFVELDSVVCNGYANWLVEGNGFGGWAEPPRTFFEIRVDRGVVGWLQLNDPTTKQITRENMERLTREDDEKAKTKPTGHFPGLVLRLRMQSSERLLQSLKDRGLLGADLRAAFVKEHDAAVLGSVFIAHEGRHVIDLSNPLRLWKLEDLEFRAKLSEVVFSPNPRLTLGKGTIFSSGIDFGGGSHDRAGRRIMKGLLVWMEVHAAEIPALDRSKPLLPQFDRLTDDQMRAAFRSMDPRRND